MPKKGGATGPKNTNLGREYGKGWAETKSEKKTEVSLNNEQPAPKKGKKNHIASGKGIGPCPHVLRQKTVWQRGQSWGRGFVADPQGEWAWQSENRWQGTVSAQNEACLLTVGTTELWA